MVVGVSARAGRALHASRFGLGRGATMPERRAGGALHGLAWRGSVGCRALSAEASLAEGRSYQWIPPTTPSGAGEEVDPGSEAPHQALDPVEEEKRTSRVKQWTVKAQELLEHETYSLKVIPGTPLTLDEISTLFQVHGARDVVAIPKSQCELPQMAFVIGSVRSVRQMTKISTLIYNNLKARNLRLFMQKPRRQIANLASSKTKWVCLNLGDISAHLFDSASRSRYDLESLYMKGRVDVQQLELDEIMLEGHRESPW